MAEFKRYLLGFPPVRLWVLFGREQAMYNPIMADAELSDQFFNSPEAESAQTDYADPLGGPGLREAAEAFKRREFHPWTAERLCRDFMRRL